MNSSAYWSLVDIVVVVCWWYVYNTDLQTESDIILKDKCEKLIT